MAIADLADAADRLLLAEDSPQTAAEAIAAGVRAQGDAIRNGSQLYVGVRTLVDSTVAGVGAKVAQPYAPIPQRRRLFLRDVVSVIPTSAPQIPIVSEANPLASELSAVGVAEGAVKPEMPAPSFTASMVHVGTLALNLTCSRQLLDDSAAFVAWLGGRMQYEVLLREEIAGVAGNGEPANAAVVGILNTPGVVAQASAGSPHASIAAAAGLLGAGGVTATAVVVHPADYFASYTAAPQWWDSDSLALQVVVSPSVPAGSAIVGDLAGGVVLFDREQASVTVYPQHSDYRLRNLCLVQAEERFALAVNAPWRLAKVTL